ncbi:MAG TPA: serine/threonine-protein kinase [Pirellulales bacterium]|nr:serine/threonine-protein kinase [Pirellulales bacterium]
MKRSEPAKDPESRATLRSLGSQIDAVCERFEASWKRGEFPCLEDCLELAPASERHELLFELLAIEGHYRRGDEAFCAGACAERFPGQAEAVRRWFAERRLEAGVADAAVEPAPSVDNGPNNRFRKLHFHARGGLGQIWVARDKQLRRDVAFKEIRSRYADDPYARVRFLREAEITGQLEHPGIPAVYALGEDEQGRPFYAMRLVSGQTLEEAIERWHREGKALIGREFRQLLRKFLDVCDIVDYAHSKGVLHRDLKPQNIMLGQHGETVVLDWGLAVRFNATALAGQADLRDDGPSNQAADAEFRGDLTCGEGSDKTLELPRQQDSGPADAEYLTQPGAVLGTRGYMCPEQADGDRDQPLPARDVFSLGAILYRILTGRVPDLSERLSVEAREAKGRRSVESQGFPPAAPGALKAICLKAMSLQPSDRYCSARQLADDLEHWLADEPVAALPDGLAASLARWSRRHRRFFASGVVISGILIASLGALVVLQKRAKDRIAERNLIIEQQRDESFTSLEREQIARAARSIERHSEALGALSLVPPTRRGWEWRRLQFELKLGPKPIASLASHDWGVLDFLWDEKTSTLVTAGHDGRLLVWRGNRHEPRALVAGSWSEQRLAWRHALFPFSGEPSDLKAEDCFLRLCWLEPGAEFVGVSLSGRATSWTLPVDENEPVRRELAVHDRAIYCVAAQQGRVLCGDDRGGLLLIEPGATGTDAAKTTRLSTCAAALDVVALPNGGWAVAQQDGSIRVLDERAERVLNEIRTDAPAWDLDVAADGASLAVACGHGQIDCYRLKASHGELSRSESYQPPQDVQSSVTAMHAVRFSPDGQWLAAGDSRGRLLVWDRQTARATLVGETHAVFSEERAADAPWPFRRRLAAIQFSTAGDDCLLAGHDPVIRRWQVRSKPGISELKLGPNPRTRFDPKQAALLWAGDGDGTLSIWDTRSRRRIAAELAHPGPVIAIDVVGRATADANAGDESDPLAESMAATCGPGGEIRCWTLRGEQLAAAPRVIRHARELSDLALSPDGLRLAACDVAHQTMVWDLATGRLLATCKADDRGASATRGRLAFNADGSRLAAFGPGATLRLLASADLKLVERPYTVAGAGGTALLWHPRDAKTFFAGDTLGRIVRHPRRGWGRFNLPTPGTDVVGIAFSPHGDGGRVAVAWRNGELSIIDPKWAGGLLSLQSPHAANDSLSASELHFDSTGLRLALVHQDGAIEIWETPPDPASPHQLPARRWRRRSLVAGEQFAGLNVRQQAVACDEHGRLAMLFTALDAGQHLTAPESDGRKLFFLTESNGQVRTETLGRAVARSLALRATGQEWLATVRRPLPEGGGVAGAFLLLRGQMSEGDRPAAWSEEDVTPRPNNEGFDVELLSRPGKLPLVVHFSHSVLYLLATWHDGARWQTARLGRQGDGFRHLTAASSDSRKLFSIFSPNGLCGNLQTSFCLATDWQMPDFQSSPPPALARPAHREACDSTLGVMRYGMGVAADGMPALLYAKSAAVHQDLLFARRTTSGWKASTVLPFNPPAVSNLIMDDDRFAFAYLGLERASVYLATSRDDVWRSEFVGSLPQDEEAEFLDHRNWELALKSDADGFPLIIVAGGDSESGVIWSFRPAD